MVVDTVTQLIVSLTGASRDDPVDARLTACPAVHNVSGIEKVPLIIAVCKHAAGLVCACLFQT